MHDLIQGFPQQLRDALTRFSDLSVIKDLLSKKTYTSVLCVGMGGSGIAGTLIQTLMNHEGSLPYYVCKDYEIPHRVDQETLVIACSHSGSTEETIVAMNTAQLRNVTLVVISSGGVMKKVAEEQGIPLIVLPDGMMPRACYTYAVVAQLALLGQINMLPLHLDDVQRSILLIEKEEQSYKDKALQLSQQLYGKTPVLYTDPLFEPIAWRTRQQLNENSKILCWHAVIPEMNHNEILGRHDNSRQIAPLFIRHDYENPRNSYRIELTKEVVGPLVDGILELRAVGSSLIEQMITTIYILDRVSVYLADARRVDPTEIPTIIWLKKMLAEKK